VLSRTQKTFEEKQSPTCNFMNLQILTASSSPSKPCRNLDAKTLHRVRTHHYRLSEEIAQPISFTLMHQTHEIFMVNRKVKTQKHSSKTLNGDVQIYNIHGTGVLRAQVYHKIMVVNITY
jgi:hypothetical protein